MPTWIKDGLCARDPKTWEAASDAIWTQRRICHRCPVIIDCARWVLAVEGTVPPERRHDVFAGLTPTQRSRLARVPEQDRDRALIEQLRGNDPWAKDNRRRRDFAESNARRKA